MVRLRIFVWELKFGALLKKPSPEGEGGRRSLTDEVMIKVTSMLDKLAKKNIIHRNKAANLKSSLALHTNAL